MEGSISEVSFWIKPNCSNYQKDIRLEKKVGWMIGNSNNKYSMDVGVIIQLYTTRITWSKVIVRSQIRRTMDRFTSAAT